MLLYQFIIESTCDSTQVEQRLVMGDVLDIHTCVFEALGKKFKPSCYETDFASSSGAFPYSDIVYATVFGYSHMLYLP